MEIINNPYENDNRGARRHERHHSTESRMFLGLVFVLVGTVLIFDNLGILSNDFTRVVISWPMLLIAIGLYNLLKRSATDGLIIIAIGTYFLVPRMFDIPWNYFSTFWPALLVIAGLIFIFRSKKNREPWHEMTEGVTDNRNDFIDETAIFGGRVVNVTSDNFKGGDVTSIFGGSTINLLHAKPAENCMIDVTAIFGGSKLIIPEDWEVKTEVTAIFGGFQDKRSQSVLARTNKTKVVRINGVTIFGGGEIISMP